LVTLIFTALSLQFLSYDHGKSGWDRWYWE